MPGGLVMHRGRANTAPPPARRMALLSAVMAAGLGASLLWLPGIRAAEVEIGAPFALTDQNGKPRSDEDFRGSYALIYFGYTFCPDVCPTGLMKMTDALAALAKGDPAKAARVVPIFITIDPARDTPETLKDYAAHFSPRLVALTGQPDALRELAYAYGVRFAKAPGGGEYYMMDHTGFTYLVGPDGRYITHFESDVTVDELVKQLDARVVVPASRS
jgi:cytochrome oxidase Cu insertion factor (SCO1/SenC/PrrC family)